MRLVDALRNNDTLTENGAVTNSTSLNDCVDAFFMLPAMRSNDDLDRVISIFTKALAEDKLTALKLLFWLRDVRGGAGERETFRDIITYLGDNHTELMSINLKLIPEYGRWDDLICLLNTKLEPQVLELIKDELGKSNHLLAKWLPRDNGKNIFKKRLAKKIRNYLKLTPASYRKLLSGLSNTIEQKMCAKKFGEIDYSKVPSKAMSDNMTAFKRNDGERFNNFLTLLKEGKTKINASSVYPYDIIKNLRLGQVDGAIEQWKSLPNFIEGDANMVLPLVDVSGSMGVSIGKNLTAMDVAISLGLYISEKNEGPFKDHFITFDTIPEMIKVSGNLIDRYTQMKQSSWGGSTNIISVFELILEKAIKLNISPDEMPKTIIILSDMEFNSAFRLRDNEKTTIFNVINERFENSSYKRPNLVFWNISSRHNNLPVVFNDNGTALIGGFSPSIAKNVFKNTSFTAETIMNEVLNSKRYENIKVV